MDGEAEDGRVSKFVCVDCEIEVTALGMSVCPVPPKGATCLWLEEFVPDPVERKRIGRQVDPERPVKAVP